MYEYYIIFVVKSELNKLQQTLRTSPLVSFLGYRNHVCLFPINSLNMWVISINKRTFTQQPDQATTGKPAKLPKFRHRFFCGKKKKREREQEKIKH